MPRRALIAMFFAFAATAFSQVLPPDAAPPADKGGPRITLSHTQWTIGTIWEGEIPKLTMQVKNTGDAPLKITRVQASCGCTAAQPAKYDLAPSEQTDITVTFDSHGKQGETSSTVTIFSNDPTSPSGHKMTLTAFVKRAVMVEPMGGVVFRTLDPNHAGEARCRLTNQDDKPMRPEVVASDLSKFEAKIEEIEPGRVYEVVAKTRPPFPWGMTRESLTLRTGLDRMPQVSVTVTCNVIPKVNLVPKAFLFLPEETQPQRRAINVEFYGTNESRITKATCTSDKVNVALGPVQPPPDWQKKMTPCPRAVQNISLIIPPGPQIPREGMSVIIETTEPGFERVEVLLTTNNEKYKELMYGSSSLPNPTAKPQVTPAQPATTQPAAAAPPSVAPATQPAK
ncbi:MAG: DUF1573 domain-containing protein [Phycisphaerales bacterium]|nr:DUF1573 domain-containing protein [Phycisphaerales bacterium]